MCTGVLTKKLMYDFWGDCLENMSLEAKKIHQKKGFFHDKKRLITPDAAEYELGVVSYRGSGKYSEGCVYRPFHELPDSLDVATEEQLKFTSLPGQGWWPLLRLPVWHAGLGRGLRGSGG